MPPQIRGQHVGCREPSAQAPVFHPQEGAGEPRVRERAGPPVLGSPLGHPAQSSGCPGQETPVHLPESVSEKVLKDLSFPLHHVLFWFFFKVGWRGEERIDTQHLCLQVKYLNTYLKWAFANFKESRLCWRFCFLNLSPPGV